MRSALLTAPYTIDWHELELPEPRADEVLVRVEQRGVCASELGLWVGREPDDLPAEIGHEIAGVVEAAGPGATTIAVGDSVVVWVAEGGGFGEWLLARERHCVRVAPGLAFPAVAEPLAGIVNTVELAAPALGDDVAIVGAGFMGNLLQLVSALKGPRSITVADIRPDALARAAEMGATRVVDTRSESLADALREVTGGRGADVTIDCAGGDDTFDQSIKMTKPGGRVILVAFYHGPVTADVADAVRRNLTIYTERGEGGTCVGRALALLAAGRIKAAPLVSQTFPLTEVYRGFEVVEQRIGDPIKVIFHP
jgi:L-iditol 2-dehydrogenase